MAEARIQIINGNWGGTSLLAVRGVLQTAYEVLTQAFGKHPEADINVGRWEHSPQVFYDRRPYEVRINAQDTYWCQYVYQFSHELCHILTNFDRHKRHVHKWFEESLCELAALFVLHRLAEVWSAKPPDNVFKAGQYAPNFRTYAQNIVDDHPQPAQDALPSWLDRHIGELESDPCLRELNRCIAVALLPHFLTDPSLWHDCAQLNTWDAGPNETFKEYLEAWSAQVESAGHEARAPELVARTFLH